MCAVSIASRVALAEEKALKFIIDFFDFLTEHPSAKVGGHIID
jgi:hypothetical protein